MKALEPGTRVRINKRVRIIGRRRATVVRPRYTIDPDFVAVKLRVPLKDGCRGDAWIVNRIMLKVIA